MIAAGLKTLLPLATFALASVAVLDAHPAGERHDAAQVAQVATQGEPAVGAPATARRSVDNSDPSQSAPATKEPRLHSTLTLLGDKTVKDLFGSTISKAYYVIETLLSDDGSSGFAVTGLELRADDGDLIQVTPPRFIALQMSHGRKLMPASLIREELLVLSSSGLPTWLFVEKDKLKLVDGKLPTGIHLFGEVSKVHLETRVIE